MKHMRFQQVFLVLAMLCLGLLTGCAGTDTGEESNRDGAPSMGQRGGGGRHGGRAQGDGNNRPGPENEKDQVITAEAIDACVGKNLGDSVEFENAQGKTVKARCQEYNDHLVAMPERNRRRDN